MSSHAISPGSRRNETPTAKFWILMGAAWFALFLYCMIGWVTGPDFAPVTFGRDKAAADYLRLIRGMEVFMVVLTAWLLYLFVFKPFLRDGKLSLPARRTSSRATRR